MRAVLFCSAITLGLAGCGGSGPLGGGAAGTRSAVAQAIVGTDLVQAGQGVRLSEGLVPSSNGVVPASIGAVLNEAANGLIADSAAIRTGGAMPKDAAAHLQLALPSLQAMAAAYAAAGPGQAAQAGKAGGYLDAFLVAARFYNLDAPAAGMPKAALP